MRWSLCLPPSRSLCRREVHFRGLKDTHSCEQSGFAREKRPTVRQLPSLILLLPLCCTLSCQTCGVPLDRSLSSFPLAFHSPHRAWHSLKCRRLTLNQATPGHSTTNVSTASHRKYKGHERGGFDPSHADRRAQQRLTAAHAMSALENARRVVLMRIAWGSLMLMHEVQLVNTGHRNTNILLGRGEPTHTKHSASRNNPFVVGPCTRIPIRCPW